MEPNIIQVGDIQELERLQPASDGKWVCHLRCLDHLGKDLTIVLPQHQTQKLFAMLVRLSNSPNFHAKKEKT